MITPPAEAVCNARWRETQARLCAQADRATPHTGGNLAAWKAAEARDDLDAPPLAWLTGPRRRAS
jgi:hypothetical protein